MLWALYTSIETSNTMTISWFALNMRERSGWVALLSHDSPWIWQKDWGVPYSTMKHQTLCNINMIKCLYDTA